MQLQRQIQELMMELKRPEFYKDVYVALYNDFLILRSIVPSIPATFLVPISRELKEMQEKLHKSTQKGSILSGWWGKQQTQPTSLNFEVILKMLETVEKKNILLEDFLACSGYGHRPMSVEQ